MPGCPSDGLLFAYSNDVPEYRHLMVFGVDDQARVFWFYPAYERAGEDPPAIPISSGRAGVELGEEIRHQLRPGSLRLFALFLPAPAKVSQVESALQRAYRARPAQEEVRLDIPGAHQSSLLVEVKP